jgi:hypothetical protein
MGRREDGCETSSQGGRRYAHRSLGREGQSFDRGGLSGDLKLEDFDAAQMNDLGEVTDEILAAQMGSLAETRFLTVGKTPWVKIWMMRSHFLDFFSGKWTHNPAAPEFKAGAIFVCIGQEGDEMRVDYVVAVHGDGDGKGGPPFYTSYLEGLGEKHFEGQRLFSVAAQEEQPTPVRAPVPFHSSSRASQAKKDKK